jgi:hypothetical protein
MPGREKSTNSVMLSLSVGTRSIRPNKMPTILLSLPIDDRNARQNKMPAMLSMPVGKKSVISLSIAESLE